MEQHGTERQPAPRHAPGSVATNPRPSSERLAAASLQDLVSALLDRLRREPRTPSADWSHRLIRESGWLAAELALRTQDNPNRFSPQHSFMLLRTLLRHPAIDRRRLANARCLELGCGALNPLASLMTLIACGAQECVGIDLEPVASPSVAVRALHDLAIAMLSRTLYPGLLPGPKVLLENLHDFDLQKLAVGDPAGVPSRLRFEQVSADDTHFADGVADIVCSLSFLEHVPDVDAVLAEMARITAPGGVGVHNLDASDHRRYGDPSVGRLDFLTIDTDRPLVQGSNRLRPHEVAAKFRAHGFVVTMCPNESAIVTIDPELRAKLAPRFAAMPDEWLEVSGALFLVTKPA